MRCSSAAEARRLLGRRYAQVNATQSRIITQHLHASSTMCDDALEPLSRHEHGRQPGGSMCSCPCFGSGAYSTRRPWATPTHLQPPLEPIVDFTQQPVAAGYGAVTVAPGQGPLFFDEAVATLQGLVQAQLLPADESRRKLGEKFLAWLGPWQSASLEGNSAASSAVLPAGLFSEAALAVPRGGAPAPVYRFARDASHVAACAGRVTSRRFVSVR